MSIIQHSPVRNIANVKVKGLYDNTEQVFTCSHVCQLRKRREDKKRKKAKKKDDIGNKWERMVTAGKDNGKER
jgi:hypothetical protein